MKTYILVVLSLYGIYYVTTKKIHFHDALVFAQKHPDPKWAPKIDYYVGVAYYQRSDYPKAQEAFTQLLLDYPTCQYEASGLIYLGMSAEENRDYDMSKSAMAKYIEDFPKGKDLELARKKLELLKYQRGASVPEFPTKEPKE